MKVKVHVVLVDVPLFISLYFVDKYKMFVTTVLNQLSGPYLNVKDPGAIKHGHIHLEWRKKERIIFTENRRLKININRSNSAIDRFFNLLKRS